MFGMFLSSPGSVCGVAALPAALVKAVLAGIGWPEVWHLAGRQAGRRRIAER